VPAVTTPDASNRDIFDEQGRKWRDVANGQKGFIQQVQKAQNEAAAVTQSQIDALNVTIAERDTALTELAAQVQALGETAGTVPQLTEQIEELTQKAAKAEKYRMLMQYPKLLQVQVEQQVEPAGEGEEPTVRTVNPLLELVESSDLVGDALQATLNQLIAALPSVGPPTEGTPPPATPAPMAPTPAAPTGTDDLASWQAKADAAHQQMNTGDMSAQPAFTEAWENIRRLQAAST
jgi:hypothetical protein